MSNIYEHGKCSTDSKKKAANVDKPTIRPLYFNIAMLRLLHYKSIISDQGLALKTN